MSAMTGTSHRVKDAERTVMRTAVESFWTAVALTLALLLFFLIAGGPSIVTLPVGLVTIGLFALWGVHARSVRRNAAAVHEDERWRHARERRGF